MNGIQRLLAATDLSLRPDTPQNSLHHACRSRRATCWIRRSRLYSRTAQAENPGGVETAR